MFLFFSRKYVNEMLDIKATCMWETINKSAKAITTASWVGTCESLHLCPYMIQDIQDQQRDVMK